jgi:prepilin-type N-terminal cleavage/methylation domain-containing protein
MTSRARQHPRRGFTLIEVLVTILFMAIVLPPVMQGIALSNRVGHSAQRRTEAATLGQSKLAEIAQNITTGQQQSGNSTGDFGSDFPSYHWESTVQDWPQDSTSAGIQQIDLKIIWTEGGHEESLTLTTIAYQRVQE